MLRLALFLLLLIVDSVQEISFRSADTGDFCLTDHHMERLIARYPGLENKILKQDQRAALEQRNPSISTQRVAYTLSLVFHIVHNNGSENISDNRILAELSHLNDAFANRGYYDPGMGVNTNIEFCLATSDENGNPTNGVTRHVSTLTDLTSETEDEALKDLSRWDPERYINVWIVKEICSVSAGCGVAGYAYLPAMHGSDIDGIVVEARFVGKDPANSGVLIHEMGHYLGLYHTFQGGCTNADCSMDGDRVCDTPPDQSTVRIPCDAEVNTCSSDVNSGFGSDENDMISNYMDYSELDCYSAFTQGQSTRMEFFLLNIRKSLLQSDGCQEPCYSSIASGFSVNPAGVVEPGDMITFTNTTSNGTQFEWYVDNTFIGSDEDHSYTFLTEGTHRVKLIAYNDDPNCVDSSIQQVNVVCPVEANFSLPATEFNIGEQVVFENLSNEAISYLWEVNGNGAGAAEDFVYQFNVEGIYNICLTAANNYCEDKVCKYVVVDSVAPCDNNSFFKQIGEPSIQEEATLIRPSSDGALFVLISQGNKTQVTKFDINGELIFSKETVFISGIEERITDITIDSQGDVVGTGYSRNSSGRYIGFAFKTDQTFSSTEWIRYFNDDFIALTVSELNGSGNYLLILDSQSASPPGFREDGVYGILDSETGTNVTPFRAFSLGSSETFFSHFIYNNSLYVCGRYTDGTQLSDMRVALSKFDLNGNEIWTKIGFRPNFLQARLYGRDILVENNQIICLSHGDDAGTRIGRNFYLQFTDTDGNLIRVVRYDIPNSSKELVDELISLPDGFLILGRATFSNEDLFLMKVDKQGNFVWAKKFGTGQDENVHAYPKDQIVLLGSTLFIVGKTINNQGNSNAIFIKTKLTRDILECDLSQEINVEFELVQNAVLTDKDLTAYNLPISTQWDDRLFSSSTIQISDECDIICEEICYNNIDDDDDGLIDCEDPDLRDSCCCFEPVTLALGPDSTICEGQTLEIHASDVWAEYRWSTGETDSTISVNSSGVYWLEVTDPCENVFRDTVIVDVLNLLPPPDLGPDITVCENGVHTLDAGNGYREYEWHDGSGEPSFTAWEEGTYWVRVWDGCRWMTDSVSITIDETLNAALLNDTILCSQDTLLLSVDGFETITWYPDEFVDCNTCAKVKVQTDTAITLSVIAQTNDGCVAVDSMKIEVYNPGFPEITIVQPDCEESLGRLMVTGGANDDYSYNLNEAGYTPDLQEEDLFPGWHNLKVRDEISGCVKDTFFEVEDIIFPGVDVIDQVVIEVGEGYWISPTITPVTIDSISWSPVTGLNCTNCPNPFAQPDESTIYTITVTGENGCTATDSIEIIVVPDCIRSLYIPNVFSPNHDGVNDLFEIQNLTPDFQIIRTQIFSRWGGMCYENEGKTPRWDGKMADQEMDPGVYVYMIELICPDGREEVLAGDITLIR